MAFNQYLALAAFALASGAGMGISAADTLIENIPSAYPISDLAASYVLNGAFSRVHVMEYPDSAPNRQCIMILAQSEGGKGALEDCIPRDTTPALARPVIDSAADISGAHVVKFTPKTAPDWECSVAATLGRQPVVEGCIPKPGFNPFPE